MPIYHTNVMICIGSKIAVICLESIDDKKERKQVLQQLKNTGKEIIAISESQMHQFAGNMLQLKGANNQDLLIMSQSARNSLTQEQVRIIEQHCKIVSSSLETVETCGGGSARCMMAEVFLPKA